MKLFHGTAASKLPTIRAHGLRPRGKGKGNWSDTVASHPEAVYLTNAYAIHYAKMAMGESDELLLLLEIDADRLDPSRFAPDEDFLMHATRKHHPQYADVHRKGMEHATRWFRNRALREFAGEWQRSLEFLGNCAYYGTIPVEAITRYATMPFNCPVARADDPTITLVNYKICGGWYRQLMHYTFDGTVDLADACTLDVARLAEYPRDKIVVADFELDPVAV